MSSGLSTQESIFLGTVLEGIFYGVYAVVFALYFRLQNKGPGRLLMYPLSFMFFLCTCFLFLDFTQQFLIIFRPTEAMTASVVTAVNITTSLFYAIVDYTSQSVLIYRCWILWDKNPPVIILPTFLAFASFATTVTLIGEQIILGQSVDAPVWFFPLGVGAFSISLAVNTIVTGIIVLRLTLVQREIESGMQKVRSSLNLWPLIAIFIESGMLTFFGELCWVVLFKLQDTGNTGFNAVGGPVTMIYGLTPTLVLVRVALGRSIEPKTTILHSTMAFASEAQSDGTTIANSVGQKSEKNKSSIRLNPSTEALAY